MLRQLVKTLVRGLKKGALALVRCSRMGACNSSSREPDAVDAPARRHSPGRGSSVRSSPSRSTSTAARAGRDARQFYDLQFEDFQRDPLSAIRSIYAHFDLPFREEAEGAMATFRSDNPRGKHGQHEYADADWGLDADALRERFHDYMRRFEIPRESD